MKARLVSSLMIVFLLFLAACAPAAPGMSDKMEAPAEMEAPPAEVQVVEVESAVQAPAQPVAAEAPAAPADTSAGAKPQEVGLPQNLQPSTRMIIKDGLMDLLVQDTDVALERVTQLAADQGGYLVSSRIWMEGEYKHAELRMGMPSMTFEDTLNKLRRIGVQVLNEQASGQDVSAEYNDLQSQLVNLEATAARVREFLEDTKTVEESLRINATLTELEGQIERVKGQMKFYEDRSAFSTITVMLQPQRPTPTPTPTPTPAWNPGKTVTAASSVMVEILKGLVDIAIWAAFLLWPFALVAVIAWLIYRRLRRKPAPPPSAAAESDQLPPA